jgi:hypothetical protein
MNKSKIIAKLDTYIKEYSKLLDINSQLKIELEREKQEKQEVKEKLDNFKHIVDNSTELVQGAIHKTEMIVKQTERHKKEIIKIFDDLDKIIELILGKENFSNEEIQNLKEKLDNLKKEINNPIV